MFVRTIQTGESVNMSCLGGIFHENKSYLLQRGFQSAERPPAHCARAPPLAVQKPAVCTGCRSSGVLSAMPAQISWQAVEAKWQLSVGFFGGCTRGLCLSTLMKDVLLTEWCL